MTSNNSNATPGNPDPVSVRSRYVDIEGVSIDASNVPAPFRHLIPVAAHWSIGDDIERIEVLKRTPITTLVELIQAVAPFDEEIWKWCSSHHNDVPVPDEVVIFDALLQASAEAKQIAL